MEIQGVEVEGIMTRLFNPIRRVEAEDRVVDVEFRRRDHR
jgi:hypothetical protein